MGADAAVDAALDSLGEIEVTGPPARPMGDSGIPHPPAAPDTYAEFLLRSRVAVIHEPPARRRSAGRQVR